MDHRLLVHNIAIGSFYLLDIVQSNGVDENPSLSKETDKKEDDKAANTGSNEENLYEMELEAAEIHAVGSLNVLAEDHRGLELCQ